MTKKLSWSGSLKDFKIIVFEIIKNINKGIETETNKQAFSSIKRIDRFEKDSNRTSRT